MASKTKKTEAKRKHKTRKVGLDRKKALAKNGSTPVFPIHPEKK
jgi:hypothetical protein